MGAVAMATAAGCQSPKAVKKVSPPPKKEWYAFSRVFQRFGCERAAELLEKAGYTGVEWTVRSKGFVEPQTAVRDLPKAIEIAERHHLGHETIIVDFLDPFAGKNLDILKVAADCGVVNYRPAYFKYDLKARAVDDLDRIRRGFDRHEQAVKETGVRCIYQNHSTWSRQFPVFGGLLWDLWEIFKDHSPDYLGIQYDFMHARAESGPSWQRGLSLLGPWIRTLCLKDFKFGASKRYPGDWDRVLLPAGQGILEWDEFHAICKREGIYAPYAVHYDYAFPETDYDAALKQAKADLDFYKGKLV